MTRRLIFSTVAERYRGQPLDADVNIGGGFLQAGDAEISGRSGAPEPRRPRRSDSNCFRLSMR